MGSMLWGLVFGSIGTGYVVYGKNQGHYVALLAGVALCAIPYVVTGVLAMSVVGVLLMMVPFFLR